MLYCFMGSPCSDSNWICIITQFRSAFTSGSVKGLYLMFNLGWTSIVASLYTVCRCLSQLWRAGQAWKYCTILQWPTVIHQLDVISRSMNRSDIDESLCPVDRLKKSLGNNND